MLNRVIVCGVCGGSGGSISIIASVVVHEGTSPQRVGGQGLIRLLINFILATLTHCFPLRPRLLQHLLLRER